MVFQISRVGSNKNAIDYLQALDRKKAIGRYIDTCADDLGSVQNLRKSKTIMEQKLMMKTLLGAIHTIYDKMDEVDDVPATPVDPATANYDDDGEEQLDDNDDDSALDDD